MERLIVQYTRGDGYTWSFEHTVPVVYESKAALEAFLYMESHQRLINQPTYDEDVMVGPVKLEGIVSFSSADEDELKSSDGRRAGKFIWIEAADIMTVDEWFEQHGNIA